MRKRHLVPMALLVASLASAGLAQQAAPDIDTAKVTARGETVPVGTAAEDAADDQAIWRNHQGLSGFCPGTPPPALTFGLVL